MKEGIILNKDINIELRAKILEMALVIEDCMSNILLSFLLIEKPQTRTLSNRSSSLSFKQKIDLLYDLDILTKEENSMLQLLMEFRNQFLHNLSCNSFEAAVNAIDGSKTRLLKFSDLDYDSTLEFQLENAYNALHIACLDVVLAKYAYRREQIAGRKKLVSDVTAYGALVMGSDSDLILKLITHCTPEHGNTTVEINLKMEIVNMINVHTSDLHDNAELKALKESLQKHLEPEQLKSFFRR